MAPLLPKKQHSTAGSSNSKTIVIKLGTSSILSSETSHPKLSVLSGIVETCSALRDAGHRVVLVCSGAIGMGRLRMGLTERPKALAERQALAALGQLRLIALWDSLFGQVGINVAQVLLTRNDIADRPRYENARTTLATLLAAPFNSIPIVNENDTVSVSELRFGDNDTLSAITAGLVEADFLFLCTDVDGLYTDNPSKPGARRLGVVDSLAKVRKAVSVATPGSSFGTGGMQTKLIAAELATAAGVATVIINGSTPSNMLAVVAAGLPPREAPTSSNGGEASLASSISSLLGPEEAAQVGYPSLDDPPHTLFLPTAEPLAQRKWSLLHAMHPAGSLIIDEGAYARLLKAESGGRLLPIGCVAVEGTWERMQSVRIVVRRKATGTPVLPSNGGAEQHATLAQRGLSAFIRNADSAAGTSTPIHLASDEPIVASNLAEAAAAESDAPSEWELVEIGRGLANYNSIESERIKGIKSSQISAVLGYADSDYIVDQLALLPTP